MRQVVKYLISRRADLTIGTRDENATVYDYATRFGELESLALLCSNLIVRRLRINSYPLLWAFF